MPRDRLHPEMRPATTEREAAFNAILPSLSIGSLERLRDLMRAGVDFDRLVTARVLAEGDRRRVRATMPPIPDDLEPYRIATGDPEYYRCFLSADPADVDQMCEAQRQYIQILRRRQRAGELDASMPSLVDRQHSSAAIKRVFGENTHRNKRRTNGRRRP